MNVKIIESNEEYNFDSNITCFFDDDVIKTNTISENVLLSCAKKALYCEDDLDAMAETLNELNAVKAFNGQDLLNFIDLSSLPTYGHEYELDTTGVFSWDDESILVCENGIWKSVERND